MAQNDIYNSKERYEKIVQRIDSLAEKPWQRSLSKFQSNKTGIGKAKYYCKNIKNLEYFKKLFPYFDSKDISYVRRIRLFNTLKLISFATEKDFKNCNREDINGIVAFMHTVYPSSKSKRDFITDLKHMWKILLPEVDVQGRIDDTLFPYQVRHLNAKQDKSKEKMRDDKLTIEEYESLIKSFSMDVRLQAFLSLAFESLGRPQEILFTKIKDVELHDNYAKVYISEHGKEGTGFLEVIDSFPYLSAWYNQHPLKQNPNAYLFINIGDFGKYGQLNPHTINKHLREKLHMVGIKKKITCYSLKRNGVTFRRLRGDSDLQIQHAARWTSTKQLKTYDLSIHDESFKIELAKRGIIQDAKYKEFQTLTKKCIFCEKVNGIGDDICKNCKRPLDREKIVKEQESKEKELQDFKKNLEVWKNNLRKELMVEAVEIMKREVIQK